MLRTQSGCPQWSATIAAMPSILLRQGDALIPLREAPYGAESVLQELVARHPQVLGGGDGDDLLLVRREAGVADGAEAGARWSVDHLFLDNSGVPVLVEVKRSTDTRIRREVVGQMLDYASGAVNWTAEQLQIWLAARCESEHLDADALLAGHTTDPDGFWQQVATNIAARRLRLVFVSDVIPPELRAVVEFLNEQMTECEVLAVEVHQYLDPEQRQTIVVPTVLGQTEHARAVKNQRPKPLPWDLDMVLEATTEHAGESAARMVGAVADWCADRPHIRLGFGRGTTRKWGSLQMTLEGAPNVSPFIFWTNGSVEITYQYMISSQWVPFDQEERRRDLADRLNAIDGVEITDDQLTRRPNFALTTIAPAWSEFLDIVEWTFQQADSARRTN